MSLFYAQQLNTIATTAYISWTYAKYTLYLIYIKIYQKLLLAVNFWCKLTPKSVTTMLQMVL